MNKKLLIVYVPIIVLIFTCVAGVFAFSDESVQKGITDTESNKLWNGVIAKNINDNTIKLKVDGNQIDMNESEPYMSKNMELMIPSDIIIDTFNCASNLYDNKKLVIEKGSSKAVMKIGKNTLKFNENSYELKEKIELKNGVIYLPVELFCQYFGYSYSWNRYTNTANLKNESTTDSFLPQKYSYIEEKRVFDTKDQGNYGTCWAFATLSALESTLMPEEKFDFSEDNLIHNNELSEDIQDGGDYVMSMAYLTAWKGPVLEADDPYGDNVSEDTLKAVKHVQGVEIIPSKDYQQIKEMVYKYGGVESSMYMSMDNSSSKSIYYNESEAAYCYKGNNKANHDVVIIGWDDNYDKELFNDKTIEGNGAFICKNSWGEDFGFDGVFYISYYDDCIGTNNVCYTVVEDVDNYDNIYQSDLCGWTGTMGFKGKTSAYFANVYTAREDEKLRAVGFYGASTDLEYQVFVCEDYKGQESLNERNHVAAEGTIKNKGYYTIELDKEYNISKDSKFAVIVKISNMDDSEVFKLVPVEMITDFTKDKVDISDGEGYFSSMGYNWQSAEKQKCNICLKAYTNNK